MPTFKKISQLISDGYPNNNGAELVEIVAYTGVNSDIPTSQSLTLRQIFDWGIYSYLPESGISAKNVYSYSVDPALFVEYGTLRYSRIDTAFLNGNYSVFTSVGSFGNGSEFTSLQFNFDFSNGLANLPVGKEISFLMGGSEATLSGRVCSFKNINFPESMPRTLRIVFNDVLDTSQPLLASNFSVSGGQYLHSPVFLNGHTVGLRIENVFAKQALTLNVLAGAVKDLAGNQVAATSGSAIINTGNRLNSTTLTTSMVFVRNTTPSVIEIVFNQMLDISHVLDATRFTLSGGKVVISATYKDLYTVTLSATTFTSGQAININIAAQAVRALVRLGFNTLISNVAITNKVGATDVTVPAIATASSIPQIFIDSGYPYYIHSGNNSAGVYDLFVLKSIKTNTLHVASFQEGFNESNY